MSQLMFQKREQPANREEDVLIYTTQLFTFAKSVLNSPFSKVYEVY